MADYSLDALVLDLEAVVERLGLDRLALLAPVSAGPVPSSMRPATRSGCHTLSCGVVGPAGPTPMGRPGVRPCARFEMTTGSYTRRRWPTCRLDGRRVRRRAGPLPSCESASRRRRDEPRWMPPGSWPPTPFLSQVRSPTLVLQRREVLTPDAAAAKPLASGIPGARLVLLESASMAPFLGDTEAVVRAIDEFLCEGEEPAAKAAVPVAGAFRTVLFTDVEGSTALTQRLGDAKAREVLREHERIVREALEAHCGSEVKTMGDGFMASFSSATRALECAIAMQLAFAAHSESAEESVRVRIGLNAGEPIAEQEDLFGTAVNLAARIAAQAAGGEDPGGECGQGAGSWQGVPVRRPRRGSAARVRGPRAAVRGAVARRGLIEPRRACLRGPQAQSQFPRQPVGQGDQGIRARHGVSEVPGQVRSGRWSPSCLGVITWLVPCSDLHWSPCWEG